MELPDLSLFPLDDLTSVKHLIYNEIVKFYRNEFSIVLPLPPLPPPIEFEIYVYKFEITNDIFKIAKLYMQYMHKIDLAQEKFVHDQVVNDMIKLYASKLTGILSKFFSHEKNTRIYSSDIPIYIYGETLVQAKRRLRLISTVRNRINLNSQV